MDLSEPSLESPVEQKISWAGKAFHLRKHGLLGDAGLAESLRNLKQAIMQSRDEMVHLGIGELCRACEEKEGGSCCGAGIERHYSASLLLLNLLLGVELPSTGLNSSSCRFLSDTGCCLLARHVICVNFLCHTITSCIGPRQLSALREKEGVELDLVFSLHERIKKKVESPST